MEAAVALLKELQHRLRAQEYELVLQCLKQLHDRHLSDADCAKAILAQLHLYPVLRELLLSYVSRHDPRVWVLLCDDFVV